MPKPKGIARKRQRFGDRRTGGESRRIPLNRTAFMRRGPRAYDPLAMQKVAGSNPIIRFARNPLQTARFARLAGRS